MVSLKSHPNKAITGFDYIEHRGLFYNKYRYRARLHLNGLNRVYYAKTFLDYMKVIHRTLSKTATGSKMNLELTSIDMDSIERFINWRNANTSSKNKLAMIRIEANIAAVFSNDLQLLKTLEKIAPGIGSVDYTETDESIPHGTKYYVNKPKHPYRVYLKSKRIDDKWKESMNRFIDRYKATDTVIVPSQSFKIWLDPNKTTKTWYWNDYYCSSHYYIDFDDESTDTLFALMFGDMISKRFKLEKRPDTVTV